MLQLMLYFLMTHILLTYFFFFFNDTATTEIYTLSLHDALPISAARSEQQHHPVRERSHRLRSHGHPSLDRRSEEHTSELQSRLHLVCRLLLEKKKQHQEHIIQCTSIGVTRTKVVRCDMTSGRR